MKNNVLIIILFLIVAACSNNHPSNTINNNSSVNQLTDDKIIPDTSKSLLPDTLKQYISDACRNDTKMMLEAVNTLFTKGKYDQIPENHQYLEKVIHENGQTIYRFNYQNSMKMLIVKQGNETTSISTTTDIYDAFVMMSLAIIEMSRDSIQILFANNDVYTGYLYKDIVAVPCQTENFHQILFYEKE